MVKSEGMTEKKAFLGAKISRGQKIVLPKVLMDELNLTVGDYVGFEKVNGRYVFVAQSSD